MIRLVKVTGQSLSPEYRSGEYVLISALPIRLGWLKIGDVIVFRQPAYGTLIKKIQRLALDQDEIYVIGNHSASVDSRIFGPIRREQVLGKVIWHLKKT